MMRDGMERGAVPERARALIDFWFGPPGDADRENHRQIWFKSTPEHDDRLRDLFLADFERAAAGALEAWEAGPESALALLLLLDQIPRNIFRATARAYATDRRYGLPYVDVIERFGRFPHRNAILGRVSTPEEIAFLKEARASV